MRMTNEVESQSLLCHCRRLCGERALADNIDFVIDIILLVFVTLLRLYRNCLHLMRAEAIESMYFYQSIHIRGLSQCDIVEEEPYCDIKLYMIFVCRDCNETCCDDVSFN